MRPRHLIPLISLILAPAVWASKTPVAAASQDPHYLVYGQIMGLTPQTVFFRTSSEMLEVPRKYFNTKDPKPGMRLWMYLRVSEISKARRTPAAARKNRREGDQR